MPIENLILIPTAFESSLIESRLNDLMKGESTVLHHCGFGPIAAAATTSEKIIADRPSHVYLLGIAGVYASNEDSSTLPVNVGDAVGFSAVSVDGIGVGEGDSFQTSADLGWPHFAGDETRPAIEDTISLDSKSPHSLLTVCAGAATFEQASRRQLRTNAVAEDMEGFAVAMACRLQNVPLQIIRGISNVAGDRDKSNWRIADAMNAAADELEMLLGERK